jgi:hypothetical protein
MNSEEEEDTSGVNKAYLYQQQITFDLFFIGGSLYLLFHEYFFDNKVTLYPSASVDIHLWSLAWNC